MVHYSKKRIKLITYYIINFVDAYFQIRCLIFGIQLWFSSDLFDNFFKLHPHYLSNTWYTKIKQNDIKYYVFNYAVNLSFYLLKYFWQNISLRFKQIKVLMAY